MGNCGLNEKLSDESPEGRTRAYEAALQLDCCDHKDFTSAFFNMGMTMPTKGNGG